jgi:pimeloyl-ACP methyl ester carboxylesterase
MLVAVLIGALTAGILYQHLGARRDRRRFPPSGRLLDVGGSRRLHIVMEGTGAPTVILESAIAASSLSWARVQPEVARITTAVAYDRAGLGWSDSPGAPLTLANVIADLRRVISSSGATPCVIVGHSLGAFVAMACAAAYPLDVGGLVLVDPPTDWIAMTQRQRYALRGAGYLSRLGGALARVGIVRACLALLTGGAPAAPRTFVKVFGPATARTLERLVGEVRKLPSEIHPRVQAVWCQPKCFGAMAGYLRVFGEAAGSVPNRQIAADLPLVVISAGDQPSTVIAAHQALAQASSRGRHIVATRSGHWVPFDEPDLVVAAICSVVDLVRQTGSPHVSR